MLPALKEVDCKIGEIGNSKEPARAFIQYDMQIVRQETVKAFALSIQSIWERQLRAYLLRCARDLRPEEDLEKKISAANWKQITKLFFSLREIKIQAFPSYMALEALHHLGNVCRHGGGTSAIELSKSRPDLWRQHTATLFNQPLSKNSRHLVETMEITNDHLSEFVDAIASFWLDIGYIYNESIEKKHPSLEARLVKERINRSWIPLKS